MRSLSRWVVVAAAFALAAPAAAQAADDLREGEQSDPAADAIPATSDYGAEVRLVDVRKVRVEYDAAAGSVSAHFVGSLDGFGHSSLHLEATLSAADAKGRCTGRPRPGSLTMSGLEVARDYIGFAQRASLLDRAGVTVAEGVYENETQTGDGPRLTFTSPRLVRRDFRCVIDVSARKVESGFLTDSIDSVRDFRLADRALSSYSDTAVRALGGRRAAS